MNFPANAGRQYCKAAVLRDMIKGTLRIFPTSPWDRGTAVAQWLRYCATNRKVAGSMPDGVLGFFIDVILPIALWFCGRLSL
jgi:hypothetical protein